jgi:hypothetical protein
MTRRRYFSDAREPFEISLSIHPGDRYAHTQRMYRERQTKPAPDETVRKRAAQ